MNASSRLPDVLPLFRSQTQFEVLGLLYTTPDLRLAIGEIAQRLDIARPTVSHEVARLAEAGLLVRERQGNRTVVHAPTSGPVVDDLRRLLLQTFGPVVVLREELSDLDVEHVAIFGSWARRWGGEVGPPPRDLDVLVIGAVGYDEVWEAAARASRRLGLDVNPVLRASGEWATDDSPFAEQVRTDGLVPVIGGDPE